ncbi:Tyrosine-protein kinase ptk [Novipirellula galeiformis]|uniref:Tyrosine-protein kinase ptk n=1 Tax=Novipirellula galeiformis TaxID=2528004 RepID=A0A5C6C951_9BACT|nr:polysaccharide biosynthesis tyrosine autokinase [Novipirellula galeiformis]TWU21233.1 Tyrosine-protein kinase ptk [Novipirellula galeiformis]
MSPHPNGPDSRRQNSSGRAKVKRSAHGNDKSNIEFDPKLLWVTVRRCWLWATPIGLSLAAAAAFIVYSRFVPIYQATHLLEANQDYVVFQGVMPTSRNLAATERQLITTDLVLDSVLADAEVQATGLFQNSEAAKNALRAGLSIGNAGVDSLLTISFKHADPEVAALVCNKVTEAYLVQRDRLDGERVSNLESWLAPSIELWKSEVQAHEKRVRELSKAALGFDPTQRVEGLENDLSILTGLRRDLANYIVEESILEAKVAMHEAGVSGESDRNIELPKLEIPEPTTAEIDRYVESSAEVSRYENRVAQLQGMIRSMEDGDLVRIQRDHYEGLKTQLADTEDDLRQARIDVRSTAVAEIKSDALELAERNRKAQLAQLEFKRKAELKLGQQSDQQRLAELKAKRAITQQEYDNEKARLEKQGGNSADLKFAQEDREVAVGILAQLNQRVAAIRTERRRGSGVHTMAAANTPTRPIEPMPTKNMVVVAAGAFAIPFLLGLLWEFRTQRISDATTLESKDVAPVIGEVARLPSKIGVGKRQRVFEESIDTLRANLMLSRDTVGVRSITIASSMSGEGKSSVSSQLAISLAKACGKTVLLIDADLRSPDQHAIFGLEMGAGLSKVLSGEVDFDNAIDRSLGDLVHVMPAGQLDMSPHRLLNASALRDLLDRALEHYSYVVIDTAPVLAAGETLAIAAETDATLVCVMRDVSRSDTVVRSSRRLEAAGANVVGTVFSGVPYSNYAYRYGDYRYLTPKHDRVPDAVATPTPAGMPLHGGMNEQSVL